jgi:hypothetical protein
MNRDCRVAAVVVIMWLAAQVECCCGTNVDPFNKVGENQRLAIPRDPAVPFDDPSLPNSRVASLELCSMTKSKSNPTGLKNLAVFWGQFADHFLLKSRKTEHDTIEVPYDDPHFGPAGVTKIVIFPVADGAPNMVTPLLDGSAVYGSDQATLDAVREGTTPFLMTRNGGMLPFVNEGDFIADHKRPGGTQRLCGDERCSENPGLQALHNALVLEHNIFAREFADAHPRASDDDIFEETRKYVVALIQKITYEEHLPALIGDYAQCPASSAPRDGSFQHAFYFSLAGYRLHHLISGKLTPEFAQHVASLTGKNAEDLTFADLYFSSNLFRGAGRDLGIIFRYMANVDALAADPSVDPVIHSLMFKGKSAHSGMDDVGMDIATFTDAHGLRVKKTDGVRGIGTYNDVRRYLGRAPARSWDDITSDEDRQAALGRLYGSVDKVSAWFGMVSEEAAPSSSLGLTMSLAIQKEFCAMAASDPNFYDQGRLPAYTQEKLDSMTFSDLVCRTTGECGISKTDPFRTGVAPSPIRTRRSRTLASKHTYVPRLALSPEDQGEGVSEAVEEVVEDIKLGASIYPAYHDTLRQALHGDRDEWTSDCCGSSSSCGNYDCSYASCSCSSCCYDDYWWVILVIVLVFVVFFGIALCVAAATPSYGYGYPAKYGYGARHGQKQNQEIHIHDYNKDNESEYYVDRR